MAVACPGSNSVQLSNLHLYPILVVAKILYNFMKSLIIMILMNFFSVFHLEAQKHIGHYEVKNINRGYQISVSNIN